MTISVITAVYNRAETIGDALASLDAQRGADVEHVVIDGGSTDGTLDTLRAFSRAKDVLVSEPDNGIYDALNKGVRHASGDVIGILHSDDLFASTDVLAQVAAAFEDERVDAVYGDLDYVRRDDMNAVVRHWRSGVFSRGKLRSGWMPPHPALFLRRQVFDRVGLYDTRYCIAADYDLILRAAAAGVTWRYIPRVLVKMRVGGASNRSLRQLWTKSSEDWRVMKRAGLSPAWAISGKIVSKVPQFVRARRRRIGPAGPENAR